MADNTKIEWADATISPLYGCSKVSPACQNCYAERVAQGTGRGGRMLFPVLTVRQPWAALILAGIKTIENRSWRLPEKRRNCTVLIHASAKPKFDDYEAKLEMVQRGWPMEIPEEVTLTGHIIGAVRFSACEANTGHLKGASRTYHDLWADAESPYWWRISHAMPLPPVPAKGKLNFWQFDYPHPDRIVWF